MSRTPGGIYLPKPLGPNSPRTPRGSLSRWPGPGRAGPGRAARAGPSRAGRAGPALHLSLTPHPFLPGPARPRASGPGPGGPEPPAPGPGPRPRKGAPPHIPLQSNGLAKRCPMTTCRHPRRNHCLLPRGWVPRGNRVGPFHSAADRPMLDTRDSGWCSSSHASRQRNVASVAMSQGGGAFFVAHRCILLASGQALRNSSRGGQQTGGAAGPLGRPRGALWAVYATIRPPWPRTRAPRNPSLACLSLIVSSQYH